MYKRQIYPESATAYSRSDATVQFESDYATFPHSEDRPCNSSNSKGPKSSTRAQLDGCLRTQVVENVHVHCGSVTSALTCVLPTVSNEEMVRVTAVLANSLTVNH